MGAELPTRKTSGKYFLRVGIKRCVRSWVRIQKCLGVPVVVQWLMNPTRNHEVSSGSIPGLAEWVGDLALL